MNHPPQADTPHPEQRAARPLWQRCRDAAAGQERIHAAGETYLPRLSGQTPAEYRAMLGRALFLGVTGRAVDGLLGQVFRKPPLITGTPEQEAAFLPRFREDVSGEGLSLMGFARALVREVLTVGRAGILVDCPPRPEDLPDSREAEEHLGLSPVWRRYAAENILNWRTRVRVGREELCLLVLAETVPAPEGEFDTAGSREVWRVYDLVEAEEEGEGGDPACRVRLFRREDAPGAADRLVQEGPDDFLLLGGRPLSFIPFVFAGPTGTLPGVEKPPLLDLAELNLAHYRVGADYFHTIHLTGSATPVITGLSEGFIERQAGALKIGSGSAWLLPEGARAEMLSLTGEQVGAIWGALERLETQMALMGGRMLSPRREGVETAETARIHQAGEASVLAGLAQAASEALSLALCMASLWAGFPGAARVELNTDYLPEAMDPGLVEVIMRAVDDGHLSRAAARHLFRRGELYPPNWNDEMEKAALDGERPRAALGGQGAGGRE